MDEAAFPPLPSSQADLARLVEMFPSVDKAVVEMVLEGVRGEVEEAMELLLGMAPAPAPAPEVEEVVSLAKAASIIGQLHHLTTHHLPQNRPNESLQPPWKRGRALPSGKWGRGGT